MDFASYFGGGLEQPKAITPHLEVSEKISHDSHNKKSEIKDSSKKRHDESVEEREDSFSISDGPQPRYS